MSHACRYSLAVYTWVYQIGRIYVQVIVTVVLLRSGDLWRPTRSVTDVLPSHGDSLDPVISRIRQGV